MEARILAKLTKLDALEDRFTALDSKFDQQATRLDQVQLKVDMSMDKLGKMEFEQIVVAQAVQAVQAGQTKGAPTSQRPPPATAPVTPSSGIMGQRPASAPNLQGAPFSASDLEMPECSQGSERMKIADEHEEHHGRRPCMPRLDFPRFDGSDASIWLDTCETFFTLYQIAPGFQVSAATMYMTESAAHWYHAFKRDHVHLNWEQFREAVLLEFDTDTHRVKMKELLQLRQSGTVAEYRRQFDRLVYNIRLYDASIGGVMLVTQFVLGLKVELRVVVEAHLPDSVQPATLLAQIHEGIAENTKAASKPYKPYQQRDGKPKFNSGEIWKAQQLKEYRRINNLCYKCGQKYMPGHQCAQPMVAQLKAMTMNDST